VLFNGRQRGGFWQEPEQRDCNQNHCNVLVCGSVRSLWACTHCSSTRGDLGETFPAGMLKSSRVPAMDPRCGQELAQGPFQTQAFGGQDILKPMWAQSIPEIFVASFQKLVLW